MKIRTGYRRIAGHWQGHLPKAGGRWDAMSSINYNSNEEEAENPGEVGSGRHGGDPEIRHRFHGEEVEKTPGRVERWPPYR